MRSCWAVPASRSYLLPWDMNSPSFQMCRPHVSPAKCGKSAAAVPAAGGIPLRSARPQGGRQPCAHAACSCLCMGHAAAPGAQSRVLHVGEVVYPAAAGFQHTPALSPAPTSWSPQFLDDSFEGPGGEAVRRGEPQRDARRRMGTLVWRGFHRFHFPLTTGPIAATPNAAESAASFSCIIVPCLWCIFP